MQHTPKYALNLIDPSDDFLPDPLNRNMETVETQLQAREAAEAALDTKFTAAIGAGGKTARIAWGSYVGNDEYGKEHPNVLTFDFKPVLVFVRSADEFNYHILMRPSQKSASNGGASAQVTWGERSVSWYYSSEMAAFITYQCNSKDVTYTYTVIGAAE